MTDPRFVHLRLHSEYSVTDGIVRIDDAVERAVADGMPALVITSYSIHYTKLYEVSPDPVVTWNSEEAATAFIRSKGGEADFEPVQLTDDAMDKMAQTLGYPVESMTFDPYPS